MTASYDIFGADTSGNMGQPAGGYFGGAPADGAKRNIRRSRSESKLVKWCRETRSSLMKNRQDVSDEIRRNINLSRGGTPWWRNRPKWKIGTKLNYCATVPLTWTSILTDAKPSVSYRAIRNSQQWLADVATAAWNQAFEEGDFERVIGEAIHISRVQKKGYLRLWYDPVSHGGHGKARLSRIGAQDVWMDENASCADDAEIIFYEYPESYSSLCARFKGLRAKLERKYNPTSNKASENASQLAPPATYQMSTGLNVTTPAYAAAPNPPKSTTGSATMKVWEFWTRPRKTWPVEGVQWLASGEPAVKPKMYDTIDPDDSEPLRRIVTEGDVIYELPESIVDLLFDTAGGDGIKVLSDVPAMEVRTETFKVPLYPDGRLVTIVDEDIEAFDGMTPLGYIPFAEISANSDAGGGQYGPSDVDLIADVYEQLVRIVSLIHDNANLAGNSVWRIPIGAEISNDDITNAPASIQREDLLCLKLGRREPAPDMPNYIPQHVKFLVDQIKELSGLSDVALGKMQPKQQISTETMTMHQEASGVRFRYALGSVSRCMRTLGMQFLKLVERFYNEPVMVEVINAASGGTREAVPFIGTYLTEPFIVEAKAGARQPNSPSARLNTIINLKNAGIPFSVDTVYALLEEIGSLPSASAAMRLVETQKNDPVQAWKVLGLPPPPGTQAKKPGSRQSKKQGGAAA